MALKSAVLGLPAASSLTLDEFLTVYPPLAGADPNPDPPAEPPAETDPPADPPADPPDDIEKWKGHSRKHEGRAKAEKERADALQAKLDKIESDGQSDHDKALKKAVDEAKAEVKAEVDRERRADRLELAVTRLAATGVTVGEGDDAKAVKFDPDALIFIEKAIDSGDLDDLYDSEGKVQTEALTTALVDLLKRKPNLAAGDPAPAPAGASDAGRGSSSTTTIEDQIRAAQEKGDVATAISLKNQQLLAIDRP